MFEKVRTYVRFNPSGGSTLHSRPLRAVHNLHWQFFKHSEGKENKRIKVGRKTLSIQTMFIREYNRRIKLRRAVVGVGSEGKIHGRNLKIKCKKFCARKNLFIENTLELCRRSVRRRAPPAARSSSAHALADLRRTGEEEGKSITHSNEQRQSCTLLCIKLIGHLDSLRVIIRHSANTV